MNEEESMAFWAAFRAYFHEGAQRKGQAMMNALRLVAPVLYDDVTGTDKDIFYRDTSQDIHRFRTYLDI